MKAITTTEEFDKWLKELRDAKAVVQILSRIERLTLGNPGQHRNLTNGVSEMKIDSGPGYRVYYTERNGVLVILLCGGTKKRQDKDIALAIQMAKEI